MKGESVKENWRRRTKSFELPSVLLLCIFFFFAGFYGFRFFNDSKENEYGLRAKLLQAGESGDDFITSIPFQMLSWSPRILYFPNFASEKQCESIIETAKAGGLRRSNVATESGISDIRTSYGTSISASEDKTGVLDAIEEKIARATKLPRSHGEKFSILRYRVGQKYNPHYDSYYTAEEGPQGSRRVVSFLVYLTDVSEGGETNFPYENGLNMDRGYQFKDCVGLKIKPRKGDGILFYSMFPNGTMDRTSLHGSCPVIKGEKWVATKWVWNQLHYDDY
ncbi:probable prolyl 4-hydroxylase 9 [Vicia villosa]|uniref:probable prolyl 4-hydroxylase 9 n=1 Tax=Vicia villosa TaxID=3911 RepID=UPI00273CEB99|nr:probable prolyl 4-hydroxylase 9 [Vicia villosa]